METRIVVGDTDDRIGGIYRIIDQIAIQSSRTRFHVHSFMLGESAPCSPRAYVALATIMVSQAPSKEIKKIFCRGISCTHNLTIDTWPRILHLVAKPCHTFFKLFQIDWLTTMYFFLFIALPSASAFMPSFAASGRIGSRLQVSASLDVVNTADATASQNDLLFDFPNHDNLDMVSAQTDMSAVQSVMDAALSEKFNEIYEEEVPTQHHEHTTTTPKVVDDTIPQLKNREQELHSKRKEHMGGSMVFGNVLQKTDQLDAEVNKKRKFITNVKDTGMDSVRNYMKTMCNHELLNKNEEIILAREIQILVQWEKKREDLEAELLRYVLYYYSCC